MDGTADMLGILPAMDSIRSSTNLGPFPARTCRAWSRIVAISGANKFNNEEIGWLPNHTKTSYVTSVYNRYDHLDEKWEMVKTLDVELKQILTGGDSQFTLKKRGGGDIHNILWDAV